MAAALDQPVVVGHDSGERVTESGGGRKVDGVERAQRLRSDGFGHLDHFVGDSNNVEILVENALRVGDDLSVPTAQSGSHQLDAAHRTRGVVSILGVSQPPPKRRRLGLLDDQLHQRGGVHVDHRSSRNSARTAVKSRGGRLSMSIDARPPRRRAGLTEPLAMRPSRVRSAAVTGTSRATNRPRIVTDNSSPASTRARYLLAFCRNSRTPIASKPHTVAHNVLPNPEV